MRMRLAHHPCRLVSHAQWKQRRNHTRTKERKGIAATRRRVEKRPNAPATRGPRGGRCALWRGGRPRAARGVLRRLPEELEQQEVCLLDEAALRREAEGGVRLLDNLDQPAWREVERLADALHLQARPQNSQVINYAPPAANQHELSN